MFNPFVAFAHLVEHIYSFVKSDKGRNAIAEQLKRVQGYITEALPVVTLIDNLTGGHKSVENAMMIAQKYGLQTVTPAMVQDPLWIDAVFQRAAFKALSFSLPHATAQDLNLAIEHAVSVLRANQAPELPKPITPITDPARLLGEGEQPNGADLHQPS